MNDNSFLSILQFASPALPVGAYSYSEGLETLIENGIIDNQKKLKHWLEAELNYGAIRLEGAVMLRAYQAATILDIETLYYWNMWLSAARETEELRASSWQMGRSFVQLLLKLKPEIKPLADAIGNPCNYAIAFGIAASYWEINIKFALLAYLQSWASNLITAGIKLIPLGQTSGQQLQFELQNLLSDVASAILVLEDDNLNSCSWGLSLASMNHETLYTRLFRS